MEWEVVIGIETHVQLSTKSKIFSPTSTKVGAPANAQASEIDLALPGVLPTLNQGAVERALKFGFAVGGKVNHMSVFARKNYFYPDLPKGYQISQYEYPIVSGGTIEFFLDGEKKIVNLTRAHLEEDAGKSIHGAYGSMSGIDLNRAGTPLLEIVSEPDMRSAAEAAEYTKALHSLVTWIGICDGNMQEGNFRCDANVSVRKKGDENLGTRREIKNLNSFRFLQQAIVSEMKWQIEMLETNQNIQQATVLFDTETGQTRAMRTKEDAHDYRYFPDPDLPPLQIPENMNTEIAKLMPQLPQELLKVYTSKYGVSENHAKIILSDRDTAEFFEKTMSLVNAAVQHQKVSQITANWITGELAAALNRENTNIQDCPISSELLADLLISILKEKISPNAGKQVFEMMWKGEGSAGEIISSLGLEQMADDSGLEDLVSLAINTNPKQVDDFKSGKEKAFNALVGQVMKASKGKANPKTVAQILKRMLST